MARNPLDHGWTRREFINRSLAMMSTFATVPAFISSSAHALAAADATNPNRPGVPADRVLVVVQLSGGNDGLNTVIPVGQAAYHNARPHLALSESQVLLLDTNEGIGLSEAMRPVYELVQQNNAAVLQGVGYPNPNRSHFASMDVWHRGDSLNHGKGWLGKAFDCELQRKPDANHTMNMVSIGDTAPLATEGKNARAIAFEQPWLFQWLPGRKQEQLANTYNTLSQPTTIPNNPAAALLQRTALDANVAADRIRKATQRESEITFPSNKLARQLELVAAMIKAELPTRVYYVTLGGFDTHANQTWKHQNLLEQFSEAMQAFQKELKITGHSSRVVTFAFSEFGRRVKQNASNGTDHGAAGPAFVFGEHVRPGLIGEHPSLHQLDKGDLIYGIDFRNVYAALLKDWMQLDVRAALGKAYRPIDLIQA